MELRNEKHDRELIPQKGRPINQYISMMYIIVCSQARSRSARVWCFPLYNLYVVCNFINDKIEISILYYMLFVSCTWCHKKLIKVHIHMNNAHKKNINVISTNHFNQFHDHWFWLIYVYHDAKFAQAVSSYCLCLIRIWFHHQQMHIGSCSELWRYYKVL